VWILTGYIEIERRFLVDGREEKPWRDGSLAYEIKQYYIPEGSLSLQKDVLLMDGIALVVPSEEEVEMWVKVDRWMGRIRVRNGVYFLTCKSKMSHDSAYELERRSHASRKPAMFGMVQTERRGRLMSLKEPLQDLF
jgi:CYTH domain-containing protein